MTTAYFAARRAILDVLEADQAGSSSDVLDEVSISYSPPEKDLDGEHLWVAAKVDVDVEGVETVTRSLILREEAELPVIIRVRQAVDPMANQRELDVRAEAILDRVLVLVAGTPIPLAQTDGRTRHLRPIRYRHRSSRGQVRIELVLRVSSVTTYEEEL